MEMHGMRATEATGNRPRAQDGSDGTPDLSESGFEMLQAAVRLARDKQITKVALLRERMVALFGGERAGDIDQALRYWGARLRVVGLSE